MEPKQALQRAIKIVGNRAKLSRAIGRNPSVLATVLARESTPGTPAELCLQIERITNKAVTRHQLRPDIFGASDPIERIMLTRGATNEEKLAAIALINMDPTHEPHALKVLRIYMGMDEPSARHMIEVLDMKGMIEPIAPVKEPRQRKPDRETVAA